jgi:capsular polysaccharide biosynthesis protein
LESLRKPLLSIRRRWWLIAEVTILAVVVALAVTVTRTTSWQSHATVIVGSGQSVGRTPADDAVLARGYVDLVNSTSYQSSLRGPAHVPSDVRVSATPVAASPLINITGSAGSAGDATSGTNAFARAFVADIQRGYASINDARLAPLRANLNAVSAKIAQAQNELAALVAGSPGSDAERARLTAELAQLRAERTGLLTQLEAQISSAGNPNSLGLLHGAGGAVEEKPSLARNAALGLLGGLALGCAIALFLGAGEGELATASRVRDRLGLPMLAAIPAGRGPARARRRSRALRAVAEAVSFTRAPPLAILVTSADREAGKGLVARGLAEAWAAGGSRVVLVEADGASPAVESANGDAPAAGRAQPAAQGDDDAEGAPPPPRWANRNLKILGPGGASRGRRIAEAPALEGLLEGEGGRARFMVVNAPPLLGAPVDGSLREAMRDGAILVVDAVRTRADAAVAARDALLRAQGTIIGVVLVEPSPEAPGALAQAVRARLGRRS